MGLRLSDDEVRMAVAHRLGCSAERVSPTNAPVVRRQLMHGLITLWPASVTGFGHTLVSIDDTTQDETSFLLFSLFLPASDVFLLGVSDRSHIIISSRRRGRTPRMRSAWRRGQSARRSWLTANGSPSYTTVMMMCDQIWMKFGNCPSLLLRFRISAPRQQRHRHLNDIICSIEP